jgi:HPt (histidine-containing phosphotransfer) domain-containing protein
VNPKTRHTPQLAAESFNRSMLKGGIGDMEEQRSGKIIVHIDPDLADLIPGYLANRKTDIAAIHEAVEKKDLDTIYILGHSMKGSGGGYGFQTITEIGMLLEKAAQEGRFDGIRVQIERLEDYLRQIGIVYNR